MKKRVMNNFGLKLLSVGIAIVFWFVIVNSQDPMEKKTFKGIPVKVLNEEKVLEREKVLEVLSGDTVDVVIEGRRSVIEQLSENDIEATADLSEVSFMDTVLIKATVPGRTDVTVLNNGENVMKLLFDDYVTRKFSLKVNTVGNPTEGYYVGDALPSPNIIQISGAKSVLDKVKEVVLQVDVNGRSVDFVTTSAPIVYDRNGDVISASKLSLQAEAEAVSVKVPILASKEMKIRVTTVGEPAEGYEILQTNVAFQPETIRVAGTKDDLEKLGYYLEVEVDVTDQTGTIEKNIQLSSLLDDKLDSLKVVDTQMVAVIVQVTPYVERNIDIPVARVEFRNLADGLYAEIVQEESIPVTVQCKVVRAPMLTAENLNPYVNLDGFTEGTYTLPMELELPAKVIWGEQKELELVVKKKS